MTDPRTSGTMPSGNGWRVATIVLAIVVGLGIVGAAIWIVVFSLQGGSSAPTPTPTVTASPTPTATPTPTPTPTPTSAAGACTADQLSVRAGEAGGAAGSTGLQIILQNTSAAPCTISGYPQVMFVGDENGTQIGAAAIPDPTVQVQSFTLASGDSVYSLLTIGEASNYDGCTVTPVDGFRVYPPGASGALYLQDSSYEACAESSIQQLRIGAVQQN